MTLKEAQESVDRWIKEYGVRYFNELTNMAILTEEVGEVARIMARRYGEQSFKESDLPGQPDRSRPHRGTATQPRQENRPRQEPPPIEPKAEMKRFHRKN